MCSAQNFGETLTGMPVSSARLIVLSSIPLACMSISILRPRALKLTIADDQRAKATFDFNDKERLNWHFVPRQDKDRKPTRLGVPLEVMSKEQKAAERKEAWLERYGGKKTQQYGRRWPGRSHTATKGATA